MIGNARRNDLISQHVEVASISRDVAERVLSTEQRRQPIGVYAPDAPPVKLRQRQRPR
jgi:hypothetical protein